jgi:hypothetical protein
MKACRILDAEGVLRSSNNGGSIKKKRSKKDWETDDFYDSDDDTYLDRTGEIEKKRIKRMEKAGKLDDNKSNTASASAGLFAKNKVHTFDSLLNDMRKVLTEQIEIEIKLEKCKATFQAINDDDLDSYIESLKVCLEKIN